MKSTIKYLAPWLAAVGITGRSPLLPSPCRRRRLHTERHRSHEPVHLGLPPANTQQFDVPF